MELYPKLQTFIMLFGAIHLFFYTFFYAWWLISGMYKSVFARSQKKLSFRSFLAKRVAPTPKRRTPPKPKTDTATVVQLGRSKAV